MAEVGEGAEAAPPAGRGINPLASDLRLLRRRGEELLHQEKGSFSLKERVLPDFLTLVAAE